jgi:tetratricopeptide (TPR) repeat protein
MIWALLALLLLGSGEVSATGAPGSFIQIARQAEQARSSDHLVEALRLYREALRLRPAWSEGWWALGSIYYDQDRFPEAQAAFSRYVATGKDVAPAYAFLGLCEYETRDYVHASEHLREWERKGSPGNAQLNDVATFRRAHLLTREGRFFEALYLLDKKAAKHGPDPVLVEAMGLAWMRMMNVPEDYPPERREMVWLAGSAAAWMSSSKLDRSHEFLDQLAAHYGQEPNVHFLRGFVYEFEKKNTEASSEYRKELKVSPAFTAPMIRLALLDVEDARLEEAQELARKVVALEPESSQGHYALGRALLAGGQWAESARELEKAKELAPDAAKVHFHLAQAYRRLGRKADADHEGAIFEALKNREEDLTTPEANPGSAAAGKGRVR